MNKELQDSEYKVFREFLEQQCGIVLGDNKQYLVKSRLAPLMQRFNVASLSELVTKTLSPFERQLRSAVIDAMTTNETLWFRDTYPYELLKKQILPEFEKDHRTVKIWSAAGSSGQEPYSISMMVEEYKRQAMGNLPRAVQIVATDLSSTVLDQAKRGEYDKLSVMRGLSADRLERYFDNPIPTMWRVKGFVKERIDFK